MVQGKPVATALFSPVLDFVVVGKDKPLALDHRGHLHKV
jgi:hypothetical protein